jgi:hypothetical protein
MTQSQLPKAIKNRARAWAGQLTSLARSFAPSHVRPAISSHVEEKNEGEVIIRVTADRRIAPDARAQEYGSGLHARRGSKHKYPIRPKTKKFLAFNWEIANANPENFSFLPDGRVILPSVQHPGIQAANGGKGYIAPAVNEIRKRLRELKNDVGDAIRIDVRRSFGKK